MTVTSRTTVLVAHGQRLFADALAMALRRCSDLIVLADQPATGEGALDAAREHGPDVVVLDFWIPGRAVLSVVQDLHVATPDTKVILLSGHHGPHHVQDALAAGATGFLPVGLRVEQVAEAVRQAHAGAPLAYATELADLLDHVRARLEDSERRMCRLQTLSEREVDVLRLLAEGRPGKEVAAHIQVALGTFRNYVLSIIAKTGGRTHIDAVNMARFEGLVIDSGGPPPCLLPLGSEASTGRVAARDDPGDSEIPPGPARVLIADGAQLLARALSVGLDRHPELKVIDEYPRTGGQVLNAVLAHRPDVVLLDEWIPGTTAAAVTRMLSMWTPRVEVLMLAWLPPRRHVDKAVRCGAVGVLSKTSSVDELLDAIVHLRRPEHREHAPSRAADQAALRAQDPDTEERWNRLWRLSPREVEVLGYLSQGLPSGEVADNMSIKVATVKNHIAKILAKTGARTQVEAVNLARYEGLVREIGPPYTPPDPPGPPGPAPES